MPNPPKDLASKYIPGLGDQFEVGLAGVGISVVDCTLAANTAQTNAQFVASAPNTAALAAGGPVVHSLGATPSAVIINQLGAAPASGVWVDTVISINFQFITADHSAVYVRAKSWTGGPSGVAVRVIAVR
jgi:hypothetical protein